jgi:DNA replication protein DnaC
MQIKDLTDELKLDAFYNTLQEQLTQSAYDDLPFEKRVQLLLEAEKVSRDDKKLQRLQRLAKLHEKSAAMEEINFTPTRGIHKATLLELAGG